MILSAKYLEFHIRFMILVPYAIENAERLKLPDSFIELLEERWEKWEEEFNKYISPHEQIRSDISQEYTLAFEFLAGLRTRLKSDSSVKLDGYDKEYFQLNLNTKSVGKIPVTNFAPALACILQTELMVKFFAFDPIHPNKKKKPDGAGSIGIKIAFINPGDAAPNPEDYRNQLPEKKSIFELSYPAEKSKMILYIIVFYISPTGEVGKESKPLMVKLF